MMVNDGLLTAHSRMHPTRAIVKEVESPMLPEWMDGTFIIEICLLFVATVLAFAELFLDISSGQRQAINKPRVALAGLLAVTLIFSLLSKIVSSQDEFNKSIKMTALAVKTAGDAEQAAKSANEAAREARVAAETTEVAASNAKEASERIARTSEVLESVVSGVRNVMLEVERTSSPINRVRLEIAFELPKSPLLDAWKERVDEGIFKGESKPNDDCRALPAARYPSIARAGGRTLAASVILESCHSLFPTSAETIVRDALWIGAVELAFFKTHINPKDFKLSPLSRQYSGSPPPRHEPDLGMAQGFGKNPPVVLNINWSPPQSGSTSRYRLELPVWETELVKHSELIEYELDLVGAQLMINLGGGAGGRPEAKALRAGFEVTRVVIRVNQKRIAIEPKNLVKHISENGDPFWEFQFPAEKGRIFTSAL